MKRKICIFCETWESGGIESFLNNILLHMDLSGLVIDLVAAEFRDSVFTRGLEAIGVRFVELSGKQKNVVANHRLFRKLLAERHYDVVHLNVFQGMSLYYAELARKAGVPVRIAHSHNTDLRMSATRPFKLLIHRLYSRYTKCATNLWACSKEAADFMFAQEALGQRGYHFIPNGIDIERFRFRPDVRERIRHELGLEDKFVIGNVGRLCYQKNQDFLLDMLAEVLKSRPNAALLLVGEGPEREKLERKADELKIRDSVVFYGTSSQVEKLLWAMDVFAFPSRFEGFGIVAVEAQAAGLPVLGSGCVPDEANVTPLFQSLPLEIGAAKWADEIQALPSARDRATAAEQVRRAGFDVAEVAKRIEDQYRGVKSCGSNMGKPF